MDFSSVNSKAPANVGNLIFFIIFILYFLYGNQNRQAAHSLIDALVGLVCVQVVRFMPAEPA